MFQLPEPTIIPTASTYIPPLPYAFNKPDPLNDTSLDSLSRKRLEPSSPLPNGADEPEKSEDDKVAKKQRRLMKNREAAAQFRHRQKAYMHKLEKHAAELTTSNQQVTAKIELLSSENKLMKEQLGYLRNFVKNAVSLSFPPPAQMPAALPPDSSPIDLTSSNGAIISSSSPPPPPPMTDLFPNLADVDHSNLNGSPQLATAAAAATPINLIPVADVNILPTSTAVDTSLLDIHMSSSPPPSLDVPSDTTSTEATTQSPTLSHSSMLNNILTSIVGQELDQATKEEGM